MVLASEPPPDPGWLTPSRGLITSSMRLLPAAAARTSGAAALSQFRTRVSLRSPSGRVGALPFGGLAILEARCFVGAAGGVAGAVRMSAGAR